MPAGTTVVLKDRDTGMGEGGMVVPGENNKKMRRINKRDGDRQKAREKGKLASIAVAFVGRDTGKGRGSGDNGGEK